MKSARDPGDGLRLWQDILATMAMFLQVNRRQELHEHDTQIIKTALSACAAHSELITADVWTALAPLMGRDVELDVALAQHRRGVWPTMMIGQLRSILTRLDRPSSSSSSIPEHQQSPATDSPRAA